MRQIRFRGFDKISDSWVFGIPVADADVKDRWHIMFNESEGVIIDDPETIGECLFIPDKHGDDIYEGDIIKHGEIRGVVIKQTYGWYMKYINVALTSSYRSKGMVLNSVYIYTIIGNTHENPELLK